jgi:hypothetical protein
MEADGTIRDRSSVDWALLITLVTAMLTKSSHGAAS